MASITKSTAPPSKVSLRSDAGRSCRSKRSQPSPARTHEVLAGLIEPATPEGGTGQLRDQPDAEERDGPAVHAGGSLPRCEAAYPCFTSPSYGGYHQGHRNRDGHVVECLTFIAMPSPVAITRVWLFMFVDRAPIVLNEPHSQHLLRTSLVTVPEKSLAGVRSRPEPSGSEATAHLDVLLVERIADRVAEKLAPMLEGVASGAGPQLLNIEEAARRLCISTSTLYKRVSNGDIKHVKDGSCVAFRASHLDEYIEERTHASRRARELARSAQRSVGQKRIP